MRILDWLREMVSGNPERLPAKSFIPLLTDGGEERGAILVHSDETRDILVNEFTFQPTADVAPHGGNISSYFADQLGATAGLVNTAIQSRQLLQVVGSPQVLAGLKDGSLTVMRSAGQMTGTVVSNATQKIAGQLRFTPANIGGIIVPLAIWQILNAIAGVTHLQRINAKLETLQMGIERLAIRLQAKTYGKLISAVAILEELLKQCAITGTFSPDMTVKLALAERDIRSALAEQQLLVQRFDDISKQILKEARGKQGAFRCNQLLKEESSEFLMNAKLLTAASRAYLLAAEVWIRHDLEHNPRYVSMRLRDLERKMDTINNTVSPLGILEELQERAIDCLEEMNWFSRNIFNRGLKNDIKSRTFQQNGDREETHQNTGVPSVVIWKDQNNQTKSVVIDVALEE
ncbi:MAG: hypothetical protein HXY53_07565 [Nitrospirae bacterium]|nr:hypothetical protein [Nitrospirota bacterium]